MPFISHWHFLNKHYTFVHSPILPPFNLSDLPSSLYLSTMTMEVMRYFFIFMVSQTVDRDYDSAQIRQSLP